MRTSFEAQTGASQKLLEPAMLELSPAEALKLDELAPHLAPIGFEVQALSGGTVAVYALPEDLSIEQGVELLERLATSEGLMPSEPDALAKRLLDELAADASCKAAVKMHRPMSMEEMEALVSDLFRAEQPYSCPHGRPVVLEMTDVELERRFGRR
jgi:DNA mismatch repair protein MutL